MGTYICVHIVIFVCVLAVDMRAQEVTTSDHTKGYVDCMQGVSSQPHVELYVAKIQLAAKQIHSDIIGVRGLDNHLRLVRASVSTRFEGTAGCHLQLASSCRRSVPGAQYLCGWPPGCRSHTCTGDSHKRCVWFGFVRVRLTLYHCRWVRRFRRLFRR